MDAGSNTVVAGGPPAVDGGTAEADDAWPMGEVFRDIARGGLAGLVAGILVAGLGGRLVMRLAALIVPSATGFQTENGNRIGEITASGSLGLIVFVGLLGALVFASVWVAIAPWLPGRGLVRGLVAMPIAVALGSFGLISSENPDFAVLEHNPLVVASLILLVASAAPAMAIADGWFDRRLPHASSATSTLASVYALLTVIGVGFGGLLLIQAALGEVSRPLGLTVIAVGIATLIWWSQRMRGQAAPSRALVLAARSILLLGTVAGLVVLLPELTGALGLA
jgi:hypothetical protein